MQLTQSTADIRNVSPRETGTRQHQGHSGITLPGTIIARRRGERAVGVVFKRHDT